MSRADLRLLLFVSALALAVAIVPIAGGVSTDLLFMAPAVILVLPLLAGRYPGEQRLTRLARATRTRRRALLARGGPGRPFVLVLARGGRLLGVALAVRPPPVAPQYC